MKTLTAIIITVIRRELEKQLCIKAQAHPMLLYRTKRERSSARAGSMALPVPIEQTGWLMDRRTDRQTARRGRMLRPISLQHFRHLRIGWKPWRSPYSVYFTFNLLGTEGQFLIPVLFHFQSQFESIAATEKQTLVSVAVFFSLSFFILCSLQENLITEFGDFIPHSMTFDMC